MVNVELDLLTRGNIHGGFKKEVLSTLRDCYQTFHPRVPGQVEVYIMDKESTVQDFLREERLRLAMATTASDKEFICSYDAWRDHPRIIVCYERMSGLKKRARLGAVRHVAAHSVLHGSLDYYIFRISEKCLQKAMIKWIDSTVLEQVIYHLSVAVKDFEASRFLIEHDYSNCQIAFALERLQVPNEAKSDWMSAKANRQSKFVYQVSLLKPILFAHPMLSLPKSRKISLEQQVQLGRRMEEMVEYMGEADRSKLLEIASMIIENLTDNTHNNVDLALAQAMSLA